MCIFFQQAEIMNLFSQHEYILILKNMLKVALYAIKIYIMCQDKQLMLSYKIQ